MSAPHVLFAPGDVGPPAKAIQELAPHEDLTTTERYMHLSPAAIDGAIRLLDNRGRMFDEGDSGETGPTETVKSSR